GLGAVARGDEGKHGHPPAFEARVDVTHAGESRGGTPCDGLACTLQEHMLAAREDLGDDTVRFILVVGIGTEERGTTGAAKERRKEEHPVAGTMHGPHGNHRTEAAAPSGMSTSEPSTSIVTTCSTRAWPETRVISSEVAFVHVSMVQAVNPCSSSHVHDSSGKREPTRSHDVTVVGSTSDKVVSAGGPSPIPIETTTSVPGS